MSRYSVAVMLFAKVVTGLVVASSGVFAGSSTHPLRVAFGHAPPMVYRDPQGRPAGFAVEALNEAARRANVSLVWQQGSSPEGNNLALQQGGLDLILGQASPERRRLFFVTEPWWSSELIALAPISGPVRSEADLFSKRIAAGSGAGAIVREHFHPQDPVLGAANAMEAVAAACSGKVDAAVFAGMFLREVLARAPAECRGVGLRTIDISYPLDFVLTMRWSDASIARRLRAELDDLTADGTLTQIAAHNPPISTPQATRLSEALRARYRSRMWQLGLAVLLLAAAMAIVVMVRLQYSRRRLAEANRQLEEDLAARARAELALRESELRFRTLLDSAPQSVLAVESFKTIAFANAKTEAMFGYPPDEIVGRDIGILLKPRRGQQQRETWWMELDRSSDGPDTPTPSVIAVRKDGSEFPVEVACGKVPGAHNNLIVFIQDTSDRQELERQIRESQKLESVGQLAGGIAHDFNNLLTIIHGYSHLILSSGEADSRLRDSANKIAQAATRASALTRQLLAFSRRQVPESHTFSLNELLRHVEGILQPLIRENVTLELSLSPADTWIHADPGQIEQVLINLVVNARDAMPDGGRLTIETAVGPGDKAVVLRVMDTGVGMTPEVKSRIFEPFFTTKDLGKGTGLGLSVVYGIVRQSGASIAVETEPHKGTVMEIRFPAADAKVPAGEISQPAPPQTTRLAKGTILVAEDEPGVREFVRRILELDGYTVLVAANGREALETIEECERHIDLLLTDTVMPEVGGVALSREFALRFPATPIVRMTGYADGESYDDSRIPLIRKPFTTPELLGAVRDALSAAGERSC